MCKEILSVHVPIYCFLLGSTATSFVCVHLYLVPSSPRSWVVTVAHRIGSASPFANWVCRCPCDVSRGVLLLAVQSVSGRMIQVVGEREPCCHCLLQDARTRIIVLVVAPFCMSSVEVTTEAFLLDCGYLQLQWKKHIAGCNS